MSNLEAVTAVSDILESIESEMDMESRESALSKIGHLANEYGAPLEVCEDEPRALDYLANCIGSMSETEIRLYDEARADSNEDASSYLESIEEQLGEAFALLSELRDGSAMSEDQKDRTDRLLNGES